PMEDIRCGVHDSDSRCGGDGGHERHCEISGGVQQHLKNIVRSTDAIATNRVEVITQMSFLFARLNSQYSAATLAAYHPPVARASIPLISISETPKSTAGFPLSRSLGPPPPSV